VAGTRIHSVRLPGSVVTTEIVFGSARERQVMRHGRGDPSVDGTSCHPEGRGLPL
jgi:4-hydroxy-tetrahydrodipicolinate reductase